MKDTNRYIALALCFSLTLGAFVYRPPEAQAIAGVDDAVVIGALLTAFSAGCGLIFANNGMTSNEIIDRMQIASAPKLIVYRLSASVQLPRDLRNRYLIPPHGFELVPLSRGHVALLFHHSPPSYP